MYRSIKLLEHAWAFITIVHLFDSTIRPLYTTLNRSDSHPSSYHPPSCYSLSHQFCHGELPNPMLLQQPAPTPPHLNLPLSSFSQLNTHDVTLMIIDHTYCLLPLVQAGSDAYRPHLCVRGHAHRARSVGIEAKGNSMHFPKVFLSFYFQELDRRPTS